MNRVVSLFRKFCIQVLIWTMCYVMLFSLFFLSYTGGRSSADIIKFINGKASSRGQLKKTPSAVLDLDNSNFDSVALDESKDVLVEFYAPCEFVGQLKFAGLFSCSCSGSLLGWGVYTRVLTQVQLTSHPKLRSNPQFGLGVFTLKANPG